MAVTEHDVRHIAALARLGLDDSRIPSLVGELNGILEHMEVLSRVNVRRVDGAAAVGVGGMPLRTDAGPQLPLARERAALAPELRDGFFLVPRLATHEEAGELVEDLEEGSPELEEAP